MDAEEESISSPRELQTWQSARFHLQDGGHGVLDFLLLRDRASLDDVQCNNSHGYAANGHTNNGTDSRTVVSNLGGFGRGSLLKVGTMSLPVVVTLSLPGAVGGSGPLKLAIGGKRLDAFGVVHVVVDVSGVASVGHLGGGVVLAVEISAVAGNVVGRAGALRALIGHSDTGVADDVGHNGVGLGNGLVGGVGDGLGSVLGDLFSVGGDYLVAVRERARLGERLGGFISGDFLEAVSSGASVFGEAAVASLGWDFHGLGVCGGVGDLGVRSVSDLVGASDNVLVGNLRVGIVLLGDNVALGDLVSGGVGRGDGVLVGNL